MKNLKNFITESNQVDYAIDAMFELFNDCIVKDDKKAIFTIKSLNYIISERNKE